MSDLKYAFRLFAKSPAFTAAAVLSLAIGIGANTAIFSVANALLLRPLPYADADRLAILWNRSPGLNIAEDWFSTAQYFDIKNGHGGFEQLAIALGANFNLTGGGREPERVGVIRVSSNLLPMLGARPRWGRLIAPEDDQPGRAGVAVLNHGIWQRRFGGDPAVVGRSITLNGQPVEIVGVLPETFSLPREVLPTLGVAEDGEIFMPLPLGAAAATVRTREDYNILGKLKPGVSAAQAQTEMDAITARLRRDFPDVYPPNGGLTFSIVPLLDQVVGNVRKPLLILLGSVGCVLLIACANVANLLLSRALARQKEIAVRASLGATQRRIVRQLLTESVALAIAGGLVGIVLAVLGVAWIQSLQPKDVPRVASIGIDATVLAFTFAMCLAAGILFGLAPALGLRRVDLQRTLKDASRGSAGASAVFGKGHNLRRLLVVAELALSVVLLIGAGLLIRSFAQLQRVPPGFTPQGVLTLELTTTGAKYPNGPAVLQAYKQLWEKLDALPGVTASGGISSLPLSGFFAWGPITVEGRVPPPGENFINADIRVAGGRYFEALGVPLRRGRLFDERDTADKPRVVVVDEFMASELWPNQDPIGKRIRMGDLESTSPWIEVVGVVGRVKQYGLDSDGRIALYLAHTQSPQRALYLTVKTAGNPNALITGVKTAIAALDPDLPLYRVQTMDRRVQQSLARQRFAMTLLTLFASLALVLAAIGVYGVMAYLVSQGTREIGIRIALGATHGGILSLVLRQGLTVAVAGAGVGLAAALLLARLMQSLLFGVRAGDPATFAVVAIVLAATALIATYVPARRAARTDPMVALRAE
ncbi:MAG TPA: ABC transporter permease [Vicinamibacterales bacterium]|nr:ABC transporter permease [Vicinamibacterales bacterium]